MTYVLFSFDSRYLHGTRVSTRYCACNVNQRTACPPSIPTGNILMTVMSPTMTLSKILWRGHPRMTYIRSNARSEKHRSQDSEKETHRIMKNHLGPGTRYHWRFIQWTPIFRGDVLPISWRLWWSCTCSHCYRWTHPILWSWTNSSAFSVIQSWQSHLWPVHPAYGWVKTLFTNFLTIERFIKTNLTQFRSIGHGKCLFSTTSWSHRACNERKWNRPLSG